MVRIPNFFLAFGLLSILKSDKAAALIKENAVKLDSLIDKEFPKKSEEIQEAIVARVLLPLAKELMREQPQRYLRALGNEVKSIQNDLSKESPYL